MMLREAATLLLPLVLEVALVGRLVRTSNGHTNLYPRRSFGAPSDDVYGLPLAQERHHTTTLLIPSSWIAD